MKKFITAFIFMLFCLCTFTYAYAEENEAQVAPTAEAETTINASQPRLMVTAFKVEGDSVSPEAKSTIEISIKNYSSSKTVRNIKLSILDETGEIKPDGIGTAFVEKIKSGGSYTWSIPVTVSKKAQTGEHKLNITMDYEDEYYTAYSASDTICINVKQSVSIDYNALMLPVKITQGDTQTISPIIMNTGKSTIRNCKITFDIEGIESGGVLFIGEIPAGESKEGSANLRANNDILGETAGTATITYEDEFGESYEKTAELSTLIEERIETPIEEREEEKKNPLWWLFLLAGAAAGGALGFAIPTAIHAKKQREEDEKRL